LKRGDFTSFVTTIRDVETASRLMRRYYRFVRETMRAMAGYLPAAHHWPAKQMLARHLWMDAQHADMLRSRTLDLRYPRVDVDDQADEHLIQVLAALPCAASDEHFLAAVYCVIKPLLREAFLRYLTESDSLDDAPSHIYLKRILAEMDEELREFDTVWLAMPKLEASSAAEWSDLVRNAVVDCGGTDGPDGELKAAGLVLTAHSLYSLPVEGGRDMTWKWAYMQVPPRPAETDNEKRVWAGIDHANEIWAGETAAALIWEYAKMPWSLYLEASRWCFDEMRHAAMGVQRMESWGFRTGIDYPMVPDHWRMFRGRGIGALLLLLHGLEQKGPLNKAHLKKILGQAGDIDSAQDCDYDWADESGHISYGLNWIKAVYPQWSKEKIMEQTKQIVEEWWEWIDQQHRNGSHQYKEFMHSIDQILLQMEE